MKTSYLISLPTTEDLLKELLCPEIPVVTISIPTINKAIDINILANIAPNAGEPIIMKAIITDNTPTPIVNPRIHFLLDLFVTPSAIRENPSTINENPKSHMTTRAANIGYAKAIPAIIIVNIPNPTVKNRDLWRINNPLIIFSIPVTINVIANNITNDKIVRPGNTKAIIENIIANAPSPIWMALIHRGDLSIVVSNFIEL